MSAFSARTLRAVAAAFNAAKNEFSASYFAQRNPLRHNLYRTAKHEEHSKDVALLLLLCWRCLCCCSCYGTIRNVKIDVLLQLFLQLLLLVAACCCFAEPVASVPSLCRCASLWFAADAAAAVPAGSPVFFGLSRVRGDPSCCCCCCCGCCCCCCCGRGATEPSPRRTHL